MGEVGKAGILILILQVRKLKVTEALYLPQGQRNGKDKDKMSILISCLQTSTLPSCKAEYGILRAKLPLSAARD